MIFKNSILFLFKNDLKEEIDPTTLVSKIDAFKNFPGVTLKQIMKCDSIIYVDTEKRLLYFLKSRDFENIMSY